MSLSALNWKKLPVQTPASAAIADVLDAVYGAFGSATYYDGTARTPGSNAAHTIARYQNAGATEAVYGIPPSSGVGGLLHQRWILAGDDAATPGSMALPDSGETNRLHVSIAKGSGALTYADWTAAGDGVFTGTGSEFFGYWRGPLLSGAWSITVVKVHCYESQDAMMICVEDATGLVYPMKGGRLIDPDSTSTQDGESATDNALYGLLSCGTQAVPTAFAHAQQTPANGVNTWLHHGIYEGEYHFGVFAPGSGVIAPCFKQMTRSNQPGTTSILLPSGRYAKVPVTIQSYAAAPNDRTLGRLREVCLFGSATHGQVLRDGTTDVGYVISRSTVESNPSMILLA